MYVCGVCDTKYVCHVCYVKSVCVYVCHVCDVKSVCVYVCHVCDMKSVCVYVCHVCDMKCVCGILQSRKPQHMPHMSVHVRDWNMSIGLCVCTYIKFVMGLCMSVMYVM